MFGLLLAFVGATILVLSDAWKKVLASRLPLAVIMWNFFGTVILVDFIYLYLTGFPSVEWRTLLWTIPPASLLMVLAEICFIRALQNGELSHIMPFKASQPILVLVVAYIVLRELPSTYAFGGVVLVFVGAYLMYVPELTAGGMSAPFRAFAKDLGPRYVFANQLAAVLIFVIQKLAGKASSPVLGFMFTASGTWILVSIYLAFKRTNPLVFWNERPAYLFSSPIIFGIGLTLFYAAMNHTLVVYVSAIGQLQPLLSIPIAYLVLGEVRSRMRLVPCLIMIGGALLIVLPGRF